MDLQINKRKYNQCPTELENIICEQYLQGKSSLSLQKEYKITPTTILNIVRRQGHEPRSVKQNNTKYTFNHNFFEKIDSEAKAYYLGFMIADGHVGEKEVILDLHIRDKHIIEEFVCRLNGNNLIHDITRKTNFVKNKNGSVHSRLNLRSDKMISDLNKLGLHRNKTKDTTIPSINEELEIPFWRGVLDGDGYVSCYSTNSNRTLITGKAKQYVYKTIETGICGHINTMESFMVFLNKNNISTLGVKPDHSIYQVRIKTIDCLKFLNLIYKNSDPRLRLKRKFSKYQEYLDYKN